MKTTEARAVKIASKMIKKKQFLLVTTAFEIK